MPTFTAAEQIPLLFLSTTSGVPAAVLSHHFKCQSVRVLNPEGHQRGRQPALPLAVLTPPRCSPLRGIWPSIGRDNDKATKTNCCIQTLDPKLLHQICIHMYVQVFACMSWIYSGMARTHFFECCCTIIHHKHRPPSYGPPPFWGPPILFHHVPLFSPQSPEPGL